VQHNVGLEVAVIDADHHPAAEHLAGRAGLPHGIAQHPVRGEFAQVVANPFRRRGDHNARRYVPTGQPAAGAELDDALVVEWGVDACLAAPGLATITPALVSVPSSLGEAMRCAAARASTPAL
jgi:hypothetical protein